MANIVHTAVDAAKDFFASRYPGYQLARFEYSFGKTIFHLEPSADAVCPRCGKACRKIHDRTIREVRDMPMSHAGERLYLRFRIRRVRCECGCHQCEQLSWLEPKARLTNAMVGWIQALLRLRLPIADVVRYCNVSWDTVKTYDKIQLQALFGEIDLNGVEHLMIDEFAVHKGHRYATVIMDAVERKVLWIGMGKTQKSVQPFFDLLIAQNRTGQIKSVSCDMNAAYPSMVRTYLPNATIVYDLFHVMKNFTHDVLRTAKAKSLQVCKDRIEKRQKELKAKKKDVLNAQTQLECDDLQRQLDGLNHKAKHLNGAEWLMVRQHSSLNDNAKMRLQMLREDNQLLADLYPIADMIRKIWNTRNLDDSKHLIKTTRLLLLQIARTHSFKPAKSFAMMLARRMEGIMHAGHWGFNTARLEGANNKIKVIKRVAFGYTDMDYFFLKIKAALPGIHFSPWTEFSPGEAFLKSGQIWKCCFPANS